MDSSSSKSSKSLSSVRSAQSSQRPKGAPASLDGERRKVVVAHKFDPSSTLSAPLSSPAVRVRPGKALSASRSQPRWAPKPPDKEEIASKPWYLLSFEEAAELLGGEEGRRERFGVFNKSFVTRLDTRSSSSSPLRFAFGSVVQPNTERKTERQTERKTESKTERKTERKIERQTERKTGSASAASSPRKTTTQIQTRTNKNRNATTTNTAAVSSETAVERDVRLRRLHGQALKAEISEIDEEISALAKDMSVRAKVVENLEREVSLSAQELQARRARAAHTLSLSLAAVDQLIAKHAHAAESADSDSVGSNNDDDSNNEQLEYFLDLRAKIESKLAALEHVDRDI